MRKKLLPLLTIAFVVAMLSTAVFYSLLAGRLNGAQPEEGKGHLVIAAQDLKPGTVLSEADLGTVPWKGGPIPRGTIGSVQEAAGKTVFEPVLKGEPLLLSRLVSKDGAGIGVPEGMRAVSIHVSDSSGVIGLLKPGYKVDLQAFGSRLTRPGGGELRTILEGVPVLAVNPQPEPSSQGNFAAPVITVLAPARDAEELAVADSFGRLRLALRNPLEPAESEDSEVREVPATPGARVRFETLALSDEGLKELTGSQSGTFGASLIRANAPDARALIARDLAKAAGEAVLPVSGTGYTYYAVPAATTGGRRVRVGLMLHGGADRFKIRPETSLMIDGRPETRILETELMLGVTGAAVLPGGVSIHDDRFRHLVVLISRTKPRS